MVVISKSVIDSFSPPLGYLTGILFGIQTLELVVCPLILVFARRLARACQFNSSSLNSQTHRLLSLPTHA